MNKVGIIENEFYLNDRLYTTHYQSESSDYLAVVPALFEEAVRTRRVSVNLARYIAASSINVIRFDYYGTGMSYGKFDELTLESSLSDAAAVLNFCRSKGARKIYVLGSRFGAFLSLKLLMENNDIEKVVLLEPVLDLNKYTGDILRLAVTNQIVTYGSVKESYTVLMNKLENGETVLADGYPFTSGLYRGFKSSSIGADALRPVRNKITSINWKAGKACDLFKKIKANVIDMESGRFSYNSIKYIENRKKDLFEKVEGIFENETCTV